MAHAKRRMRMQVRATPDAGDGTFEAVVSTYELEYDIGYWTEQIMADCFEESIAAHPVIPIFYNHDWYGAPIGSGRPVEDGLQLKVAGRLYLEIGDPLVARVYQAMIDEALEEWSIGFWPLEISWNSDNPQCDYIVKGDLAEASVCVRGANPETGTIDLASRGKPVYVEGGEEAREREVVALRTRFRISTPAKRAEDEPADHTHEHSHDGGETSHSHEHTHSAGNYDHGDSSADPDNEVAHTHAHADEAGEDSREESERSARILESPHWREYAAGIRKEAAAR